MAKGVKASGGNELTVGAHRYEVVMLEPQFFVVFQGKFGAKVIYEKGFFQMTQGLDRILPLFGNPTQQDQLENVDVGQNETE